MLERWGRAELVLISAPGSNYQFQSKSFSICWHSLSSFCCFSLTVFIFLMPYDPVQHAKLSVQQNPKSTAPLPRPQPGWLDCIAGGWQATLTSPSGCPKHKSKNLLIFPVCSIQDHIATGPFSSASTPLGHGQAYSALTILAERKKSSWWDRQ